jgi:hypothetical protein
MQAAEIAGGFWGPGTVTILLQRTGYNVKGLLPGPPSRRIAAHQSQPNVTPYPRLHRAPRQRAQSAVSRASACGVTLTLVATLGDSNLGGEPVRTARSKRCNDAFGSDLKR